jgi:hypothetical protein
VDPTTRRAARLATFTALPIALVAGAVAFGVLNTGRATPKPAASAPGTVTMAARTLSPADAQMCLAFIAQLPVELRDITQRHVSDGPEQNVAYGDPPLTAACGVPPVAPAHPTDTVFPLSGVCWYATQRDGTSVWTTLDRKVAVRVTIPDAYTGAGQWATEFAAAIKLEIPSIPTKYDCSQ